jgi:RNA recognition motif-containing protein
MSRNRVLPQVLVQSIPNAITEAFLEDFFGKVRPVHSPDGVQIYRSLDRAHRLYAYAFVTFDSSDSVDAVISELNYVKINGIPICIVRVDPETRAILSSRKGNIVVKNLDPLITEPQLHANFSEFGEVLSCKIVRNEQCQPLGYGFVQFKQEAAARAAIQSLDRAIINGREVRLEPVPGIGFFGDEMFTIVFLKNLPEAIDSQAKFEALLQPFGVISRAKFSCPDGRPKFGSCRFTEHAAAVRAIAELNGQVSDGVALVCERFKSPADRCEVGPSRELFVLGFGPTFKENELRQFFAQFGDVERVEVRSGPSGVSRIFAFVLFGSIEDAENCIAESTLMMFPDTGKQVFVAKRMHAEAKKDRQAKGAVVGTRLRQEIVDQVPKPRQAWQKRRVMKLSDDQVFILARDQDLLARWMAVE